MSVSLDGLLRRDKRNRLCARQQIGLRNIEYRRGAKHGALGLIARRRDLCLVRILLSVSDAYRREDLDRTLTLAHTAVQVKERVEARDVGRVRALHSRSATGCRTSSARDWHGFEVHHDDLCRPRPRAGGRREKSPWLSGHQRGIRSSGQFTTISRFAQGWQAVERRLCHASPMSSAKRASRALDLRCPGTLSSKTARMPHSRSPDIDKANAAAERLAKERS
jgi:hypothetical protein